MKNIIILVAIIVLLSSCQERGEKPIIHKNTNVTTAISCLKLASFEEENLLTSHLRKLYNFTSNCDYTLTLSYKKDIVCNSSYNAGVKSMGKFPTIFIKLDVRKGLDTIYSYYQDLYDNIEPDDIDRGFNKLKDDLLEMKLK